MKGILVKSEVKKKSSSGIIKKTLFTTLSGIVLFAIMNFSNIKDMLNSGIDIIFADNIKSDIKVYFYQPRMGDLPEFKDLIMLTYFIVNEGSKRANNIEIQLTVTPESVVGFIPSLFEFSHNREKRQYGDQFDQSKTSFMTNIYKANRIDPGDITVLYIYMNKEKFESINGLQTLDLSVDSSFDNRVIPNFGYFNYKEGKAEFIYPNRIGLVDVSTPP
jgi:hypothetical protein|tara:strand:- start:1075 stop:1728 length:654 start_codon:yes stop_codon:yes gene_type:complete